MKVFLTCFCHYKILQTLHAVEVPVVISDIYVTMLCSLLTTSKYTELLNASLHFWDQFSAERLAHFMCFFPYAITGLLQYFNIILLDLSCCVPFSTNACWFSLAFSNSVFWLMFIATKTKKPFLSYLSEQKSLSNILLHVFTCRFILNSYSFFLIFPLCQVRTGYCIVIC